MKKPVLGMLLGAILGVFDGLSALISAPEVAPEILSIVIGSTFKGVIAGVLIGWFARKVDSLPAGIAFGLAVGAGLAWLVAVSDGRGYYLEMMLPGGVLGVIVGYATQRHGVRTGRAAALVLLAALPAALASLPSSASAQDVPLPAGWRALTDHPSRHVDTGIDVNDGASYSFVEMAPGWHITTGPGVLLFDERVAAGGSFRIEMELFVFPNPSDQPLGLFFGGDVERTGGAEWLALLIRRDGRAAVAHQLGAEIHEILPWQPVSGLEPHPGPEMQELSLAVDAAPDSVRFFVNGNQMGALARAAPLAPEGRFGMRIGQALNLHVVRLDYTQRPTGQRRRDDE